METAIDKLQNFNHVIEKRINELMVLHDNVNLLIAKLGGGKTSTPLKSFVSMDFHDPCYYHYMGTTSNQAHVYAKFWINKMGKASIEPRELYYIRPCKIAEFVKKYESFTANFPINIHEAVLGTRNHIIPSIAYALNFQSDRRKDKENIVPSELPKFNSIDEYKDYYMQTLLTMDDVENAVTWLCKEIINKACFSCRELVHIDTYSNFVNLFSKGKNFADSMDDEFNWE